MGRRAAGADILHPLALAAVVTLVLNDHLLKGIWPGLISGKLSDVAGLVIAPIALVAAWEIARATAGAAARGPSRQLVATVASLAVGGWFAAVKLVPTAADLSGALLGLLQWPFATAVALMLGLPGGPPGVAPIAADATDLVTLPALVAGWLIARGHPPGVSGPRPTRGPAADRARRLVPNRVAPAILGLSVVALAATSPAIVSEVTIVSPGIVTLGPDVTMERRDLTVLLRPRPGDAIWIEARQRWPFVEPPVALTVTRLDETSAGIAGPVVGIDPRWCGDECDIPVRATIAWADAAGAAPTSVAWELSVMLRAPDRYTSAGSARIKPPREGRVPPTDVTPLWAVLALIAAVVAVAPRASVVRPRVRPGAWKASEIAVLVATSVLAAGLIAFPFAAPAERLEPVAGGTGRFVALLAPGCGVALLFGLLRWWRGAGALLAVALLVLALLGLPFAARLLEQAPGTFAERGFQLIAAASALGAASLTGALAWPRVHPAGRPLDRSRIVVLGSQVALTIGLGIGALMGGPYADPALALAVVHALGIASWWRGSGLVLGPACLLAAAGAGFLLVIGGPQFLGPRWGVWDRLFLEELLVLSLVGLAAALGWVAPAERRTPASDLPASSAASPQSLGDAPLSAPETEAD